MENAQRVLVLGASGMLGHTVFRLLSQSRNLSVYGTVRRYQSNATWSACLRSRLVSDVNVETSDALSSVFTAVRPNIVVNCIGLVKQLEVASDPLLAIPINALLPHRLARICLESGARLIHISTDCVFSGSKGFYKESDPPDITDLYGLSKLLGEVVGPQAITLRTSIIGHEISTKQSLLEWFLAQQGAVLGYKNAFFSGLPTVELARVIRDFVIPAKDLSGLYHVSASPISKLDLLELVAKVYGKQIQITPDERVCIDRSLDSSKFNRATGYVAAQWPEMVHNMFEFG